MDVMDIPKIDQLSTPEKILLVEDLWDSILFGYNDTEHKKIQPKTAKDYRKMIVTVWKRSRKPAKIRGGQTQMFKTLKKEASCYDYPISILLRNQDTDKQSICKKGYSGKFKNE